MGKPTNAMGPVEMAAQFALRTGAGRLVGLTEGAIRAAIARGELATYEAADGTRLVYVPELLAWRAGRAAPQSSSADELD